MHLTVSILGPLQVHADGTPIPIRGTRLRALLTRLALNPDQTITTPTLTDALWNEQPPDGATNALQSLISRLRKTLGHPDTITATPGGYRLALPPTAIDAHRFETLTRKAHNTTDPATARTLLREALALWRGPALADLTDTPFALAPAARLDELRLSALTHRLHTDLQLGHHTEALPELEALAAEYPLRENIAALLMRALYAAGRQADALAVYERVRAALDKQLGIDPSAELADVHLAVLRNDPGLSPSRNASAGTAPAAVQQRRTNLRSRLTSFVGRDDEIARIGTMLGGSRLVTLVGPGGAGKTRLAGEAAARLLEAQAQQGDVAEGAGFAGVAGVAGSADVPDGVWLVELAPVTDPAELPQAILVALGQRETRVLRGEQQAAPVPDALTRLAQGLAGQRLLIVLDNCEHLVDAAAHAAEYLLEHVPGLRILATSREPLGIGGENLFPVLPLAQPDEETGAAESPGPTPAEALAYPAVRLFADRAAAVQPDFTVDDRNVADVVKICRRLDGLPLAIELAAARLRTLPVHAVASRLGDRFRLLTGGSRTAMPRHQTLRAVVAWSWELLSEDERDLAERLSVFPGGITAESAASVHPGNGSASDIDELLFALVDKSLLQPVEPDLSRAHADTAPRYRMLETLREYGIERLAEAGTITDVRRAHARYFRDLAEQAEPHLRRREQLTWLARLDADNDNILAALRYAADSCDADTAVRLAAALAWYWSIVGQTVQGRAWLELALSVNGESPAEARAVVKILHALTGLFSAQDWSNLTDITSALAAVLDDVGATPDNPLLAIAACTIPIIMTDDLPGVFAAVAAHENHPDPWVRGMLRLMRAMAAENSGDLATQREDLEEARRRFTQIGERWGLSATLSALAAIAMADGDPHRAIALQDEALSLLREINASDDAVQVQMMRATALAGLGALDEAKALAAAILESGRRTHSKPSILLAYVGLANIARREGDTETAWEHLRASQEITRDRWLGPPQLLAIREVTIGLLHLAGDGVIGAVDSAAAERSRTALQEAYELGAVARDMPVLSRIAVAVACYAAATADPHAAARALGTADALRGGTDLGDPDRADVARSARAQLGDDEFERSFASGRAAGREEALRFLADYLGVGSEQTAEEY